MCIRDLIDQFEIQGAFHIKAWKDDIDDYEILAIGIDFECQKYTIKEQVLERRITYMYATNGKLHIEVE